MTVEKITSRKNEYIRTLKANAFKGEIVCEGLKMLEEADRAGAEVTSILWKETALSHSCGKQYVAPADLFDYASPVKNSPGPIFTAVIPEIKKDAAVHNAVILENVQDPGNVGTVIRTANALGLDCVYLYGNCASLHNPKTVSATKGAVFTQRVEVGTLPDLPIYAAVLADGALSIKDVRLKECAVAIGSEGHGLSDDLKAKSDKFIIIPMEEGAESLNAAVAASICIWEMMR